MTMSIFETTLVVFSLGAICLLIRRVGLRQVMHSIGEALPAGGDDIHPKP